LVKALESRYDPKSPQTRHALKLARQLADTPISTKLPTVANSLQAIESLREDGAENAGHGATGEAPAEEPAEPSSSEPGERSPDPAATTPPAAPSADPAASAPPANDTGSEAGGAQGAVPAAEQPALAPDAASTQPAPTTPRG
jgi:uroporphyrin-3 C-methyltransferase